MSSTRRCRPYLTLAKFDGMKSMPSLFESNIVLKLLKLHSLPVNEQPCAANVSILFNCTDDAPFLL